MKKLMGLALLFILLLQSCALALTGTDYPAWDGAAPVQNALAGSIDGANIQLEFDASADYSMRGEGYLLACFFAYDAAQQNYIELYLLMPETIAAGDVITPQTAAAHGAELASNSLFEVYASGDEAEYMAGQIADQAYPTGSSYSIAIESAQTADDKITVSGNLDAILSDGARTIALSGVQFHFALPTGNTSAAPQPAQTDSVPENCVKV